MKKIKLGVSGCLLGERLRYDGGHKLDQFLRDVLGRFVEYTPVCPEVECGLSIPREPMRLEGGPWAPRMVAVSSRRDMSGQVFEWSRRRIHKLESEGLCGFIFKSGSPSCGLAVHGAAGFGRKSTIGLFAREFISRFPSAPVEEETRLRDWAIRENFIERIIVHQRWLDMTAGARKLSNLVDFHTRHKFAVLSHSPKQYALLGRIVAGGAGRAGDDLFDEYLRLLMDGLKLKVTVGKNTKVLRRIAGCLKKCIPADEKCEIDHLVAGYASGLMPLAVPVALVNHFAREHGLAFLDSQHYLNPHPIQLRLGNHLQPVFI